MLINENNNKKYTLNYPNGIIDYIYKLNKELKSVIEPIYFKFGEGDIFFEITLNYVTKNINIINSFVNNIKTNLHGSHVTGFKYSLTKTINEYAIKNSFIKNNNRFINEDIQKGLIAIISILSPEKYIQYEGQIKEKLYSSKIRKLIEINFSTFLNNYLIKNKNSAEKIMNYCLKSKKERELIQKAKKSIMMNKKIAHDPKILSGKLIKCKEKKSINSEIFLVEGDSAGGTAKNARNWINQAILPLKGKILNTLKSTAHNFNSNVEINSIINALKCGYGDIININKLRYHKIIIMTDADKDGAHIQTLLLTFFWIHMKELVLNGNIYVALPPLFKCELKKSKKSVYFWTEKKLNEFKKNNQINRIQRFKGLGEMNADQLWMTAMNPDSRSLLKVNVMDKEIADKTINKIMGPNIQLRKKWIDENIYFSLNN